MNILLLAGNRTTDHESVIVNEAIMSKATALTNFAKVTIVTNDHSLLNLEIPNELISVLEIPSKTAGALATAAFGLQNIADESPFLLIPTNSSLELSSLSEFTISMTNNAAPVGAVVFEASDPLYSYARIDSTGQVVEIVEKEIAGSCALAGYYFFRNKDVFRKCVQWAMVNNVQKDGVFFISPSLNYFLANSQEIVLFEVPENHYSRLTV